MIAAPREPGPQPPEASTLLHVDSQEHNLRAGMHGRSTAACVPLGGREAVVHRGPVHRGLHRAAQEEGPQHVPGASAGPGLPRESGARSPPAPYVESTAYTQARAAGSSHSQTGTGPVSTWPVHWVRGPQDPRRVKLPSEQPACGDGTSHGLFPARLGGGVGPPAAHVPGVTGCAPRGRGVILAWSTLPPTSLISRFLGRPDLLGWEGERCQKPLKGRKEDPHPEPVPGAQRAALQAGSRDPHPHPGVVPTPQPTRGLCGRTRGH